MTTVKPELAKQAIASDSPPQYIYPPEDEIDLLEKEKKTIEDKIGSGDVDYAELQELSLRIGAVIESIDEKTYRWMELDEYAS